MMAFSFVGRADENRLGWTPVASRRSAVPRIIDPRDGRVADATRADHIPAASAK